MAWRRPFFSNVMRGKAAVYDNRTTRSSLWKKLLLITTDAVSLLKVEPLFLPYSNNWIKHSKHCFISVDMVLIIKAQRAIEQIDFSTAKYDFCFWTLIWNGSHFFSYRRLWLLKSIKYKAQRQHYKIIIIKNVFCVVFSLSFFVPFCL